LSAVEPSIEVEERFDVCSVDGGRSTDDSIFSNFQKFFLNSQTKNLDRDSLVLYSFLSLIMGAN
jgi:hypothetical protein